MCNFKEKDTLNYTFCPRVDTKINIFLQIALGLINPQQNHRAIIALLDKISRLTTYLCFINLCIVRISY